MAVIFKDKKLYEDLNKIDIAFLVMHDLLIEKGIYTKEEFEELLKNKINDEESGEEDETRN